MKIHNSKEMSMLESARAAGEEMEALEMGIVEELEGVPRRSHKSKLAQELRIRNLLVAAKERAKRMRMMGEVKPQGGLNEFYKRKQLMEESAVVAVDDDPAVVAKLSALGGEMTFETEEQERALVRPRNRLERRAARAKIDEFVLSHEQFTGEEHLGRFLDLHENHMAFQNLHPSFTKVTYLDYLRTRVSEVPISLPDVAPAAYRDYLANLLSYLRDFEKRATPLSALDLETEEKQVEKPFEAELKRATNPDDLEKALSLPQLKAALEKRGLKASGTASQRAARLFAVKSLQPDQYPLELLSTTSSKQSQQDSSSLKQLEDSVKEVLERVRPFVSATQAMVTKKMTMTYEEIAKELDEEEKDLEAIERSDDEDNVEADDEDNMGKSGGVIDPSTGRLIPKWKFRLYGLNQEFKCEICGGHTYFGRKAYEKHFRDYRHANGMRALGIPNTAHFHDITSIEDARRLYESLKVGLEKTEFNRQKEEEFEDAEGNVLSRSAYEDLKREGIL